MSYRLFHRKALFAGVPIICAIVCLGGVAIAQDIIYDLVLCELDNNEQCIEITLPCLEPEEYGLAAEHNRPCEEEKIQIPNGRPIYAFLVNGFDQNHNFDKFHFYNFAKCIFRQALLGSGEKAYVHFAWWNNLLAPYMEEPLHNSSSTPGSGALDAISDYLGFSYTATKGPDKAIPPEDYQFQKDAKAVLETIRENNPDASIILVGHSMGGDAVIRLADSMPEDFAIDLLAPIDPVGNRTCLPTKPWTALVDMEGNNTTCLGANNFTRFQATHTDWYEYPYRISFEDNNIGYLYHRWQTEFAFPFDWGCPNSLILCPLWDDYMLSQPDDERILPDAYLFRHNELPKSEIGQDSTNVQSRMPTSLGSGKAVFPNLFYYYNWGGWWDGHGEIVGFRALKPSNMSQSYPLALEAQGDWPSRDKEQDLDDPSDSTRRSRIRHLKKWETQSTYPDYYHGLPGGQGIPFAPKKPDLCMVSDNLCTILANTLANQRPVADANGPYESVCEGTTTTISLDGTGSSDPEGATLAYSWYTDCPGLSLDDSTSATPVLTVDTSNGCAVECIVELTVTDDHGNVDIVTADVSIGDTVSPELSIPADVTIECDESSDPSNTGLATAIDACDSFPTVNYTDVETPGSCPHEKTITRTWTAVDYCGNSSIHVQTIEIVDTTPPVITCNEQNPITPPDVPISFTATAIDNCDGAPVVRITDYECYKFTKKGKKIDKDESCLIEVNGDQIAILDSGGVDDNITWRIEATDICGNISQNQCKVLVVNPGK